MLEKMQVIRANLKDCCYLVDQYAWLLDSYVLDYYVDNHGGKLPKTWQSSFQSMDPNILGDILSGKTSHQLLPLSFLALMKAISYLSLNRVPTNIYSNVKMKEKITKKQKKEKSEYKNSEQNCANHPCLRNLFLKHVKAKKRHEILSMCDVVRETALKVGCPSVMDVGSGVGHLIRSLTYQHDIETVGVERQQALTVEARKNDKELEITASKYLTKETMNKIKTPHHVCALVTPDTDLSLLSHMKQYGVIGLHPCGDLGPFLLRQFVKCDRIKFICVVGCCYMKISCEGGCGYPMSLYVTQLGCRLRYASREIACHAIEVYIDRLKCGNYRDLQVHSYRAALEVVLLSIDKNLKHTGIRSVKHTHELSFERYCELALHKLGIDVPAGATDTPQIRDYLSQWRHVVIFYSLRLMLAPLVETIVLLDRVLYLAENGFNCDILPVFDPRMSPRNHVIIGTK